MKKVIIIGSPGAGKSTLAFALSAKTRLPLVHLDQLFWHEGWIESDREDFDARLACELEKPKWIIDGNYSRTLPQRLEKCDTVIFLDLPRRSCLMGVIRRVLRYRGKTRPDMTEGCPEKIDREFLSYVWHFRKKNIPAIKALLSNCKTAEIITLHSRREIKKFISDRKKGEEI